MLLLSYLRHQPYDRAYFFIYCSSHKPLLPDWRDLKYQFFFDITRHRKYHRKLKEMHPVGQFRSLADSVPFHRWIMSLFGYVVRLDVVFIMDSGDWKHTLRQGVVHVESSSLIFRLIKAKVNDVLPFEFISKGNRLYFAKTSNRIKKQYVIYLTLYFLIQ